MNCIVIFHVSQSPLTSVSLYTDVCASSLYSWHCFFFFLIVLGLHRCMWTFSSWQSSGDQELLSSCNVQPSHCSGFSCCTAQALSVLASVAAVCWLQSVGSVVVPQVLSCSSVCGIFPDQKLNWCSLHCKVDS